MRRQVFFFATMASAVIVLSFLSGCTAPHATEEGAASQGTRPQNSISAVTDQALFKDVAASVGLKFKHILGDTGHFRFDEFTAPGCAFIDYNNDGYPDIFLIQSGSSAAADTVQQRPHCALYHNNRNGTFTDVTAGSGLAKDLGYGQGVAVGDYDNDGYDDLFITSYGGNHLFRNLHGSGHFEDVTLAVGLSDAPGTDPATTYATSAAFGDYDNDGRLDLYVCYYAHWSPALDKECRNKTTGQLDYCVPQLYEPMTHRLYHNVGGRFMDVSQQAGITAAKGRGLAVAWLDFNHDGRPDIFVANDVTPNMLWRNNGNGTFTNVANQTGCAYDGEGRDMSSMGVAVADYDRSGRDSLYVTNFSHRPNILFKNMGSSFEDMTGPARLGFSHLKFLSFGCAFLDYDADGWPDLIVNNGHVQLRDITREAGVAYKQRKQLLHNEGGGIFREITDLNLLGDLMTPLVGRGLAVGDYDNDGHLDILAMAQNAPAQLLHNQAHNSNHWVSFKTVGTRSNRDGIHTRFELKAGDALQTATVQSGSSYLSSSDRRVYFGLGKAANINQVSIRWPSGIHETLKNLAADTFYTVTETHGITSHLKPPTHP